MNVLQNLIIAIQKTGYARTQKAHLNVFVNLGLT